MASVLSVKGHDIWSIGPDETVFDAIKLMADKGVGALLVMNGERLTGIVSERDYARKVVLLDRSSRDTPVREIMTDRVFYARPKDSIDSCMALMTDKHIRHLPIVENEHVVGIVSIGDLVKSIIAEREEQIDQLERYITGGR